LPDRCPTRHRAPSAASRSQTETDEVSTVMQKSVLIVDEDDLRRRGLAHALAARGERCLDVADGFAAMAAFGRARFSFVIAAEGRRRLSLRGLCQLARKRHPEIPIFILPRAGSTTEELHASLGLPVDIVDAEESVERMATRILARALAISEEEETRPSVEVELDSSSEEGEAAYNPFDGPGVDLDVDVSALAEAEGLEPVRASTPVQPTPSIRPPSMRRPSTAPTPVVPLTEEEATERHLLRGEEERPEPTQIDALRPSSVTQSAPSSEAIVVVDGQFDDVAGGAGAALLMSLFAQEFTGRLLVPHGEAQGTLYLHRGEPVWVDDPQGDAGLYRKLVQKAFVRPDQAVDAVAEGALLGSLLSSGTLDGERMHAFMREVVRDRVIAVATQTHGEYRFTEDRAFLDTAPLLKVNPFGLILESRRRQLAPPALMALQTEIEGLYAIPGPGLGASSEKIRPFLRGARAVDVIDGRLTVRDLLGATGLDPFMGTLVVVVMRDSRLVALEPQPRVQDVSLHDSFIDEVTIEIAVDDDLGHSAPASADEARVREDFWALYLRLKPLTQPRQVLGVRMDATDAEVDAAYRARLAELDPGRVPESLTQRVHELRRKVENAWQTLKMQLGSSEPGGNNPF
jgi:CheY-like chemotaxis protein